MTQNIRMKMTFLKLFQKSESHLELGMSRDIQTFLSERNDIKIYSVEVKEREVIAINIELYNFSRELSKKLFLEFLGFVGYEENNLFICEKACNKDRYLYLTKGTGVGSVKMEIIIS